MNKSDNQSARKGVSTSKCSTGELFARYAWFLDLIRRSGGITFGEINERWRHSSLNESGEVLPLKTFHNYKNAIQQMFDINIGCNRRAGYVYHIENEDDILQDGVRSWLLDTFTVNNLISESRALRHRILFEKIPSGRRFLALIIEAMRDGVTIEVLHHNFRNDSPRACELAPYCIKIFRQRWYLVAASIGDYKVRIYGLDRICNMFATNRTFEIPAGFDPQGYFDDAFGIIVDEGYSVEHVIIRTRGGQQNYLRSLPLHHSQAETERTDDYSVFEYRLCPTPDFQQELLSYGARVEVVAPQWLRKEICGMAKKMVKVYDGQNF